MKGYYAPMANDSSPLFWFVLTVLGILTGWAYVIWRRSWNKLNRQEITVVEKIRSAEAPTTWEEAGNLLPDSMSVAVATLRRALTSGSFNADAPEYYDWIQTPRYLAGIFVFIGLLGTILGIAVSVSSLGAAVSTSAAASDQLSDISRHIFDLLSGMKYAFYCTIGGLLSTLLISALNAYYLSHCRQLEMQVEALAYRVFIPMNELALMSTPLDEISMPEVIESLRLSVEELSLATTQFSEHIVPIAQAFEQTAANTTVLSDTLLNAGATLRDELKDSSDRIEAVRRTMEFAGDGFRDTLQNLADIAEDLEGAATIIAGERTSLNSTIKDAALEMASSVRSLQEAVTNTLGLQQTHLDQLIAHSTSNLEKMGLLLRQFELTLADVTAISEQTTLRQDVQHLIEQLRILQQETSTTSPQREMAAMRSDLVMLSKHMQTVGTQLTQVASQTQRVDANISIFSDQVTQVRRQVSAMDEQQNAPVSKRLPRVFQKDYWV